MDDYIYISTQFLKTDLSARTVGRRRFLLDLFRNSTYNDIVFE